MPTFFIEGGALNYQLVNAGIVFGPNEHTLHVGKTRKSSYWHMAIISIISFTIPLGIFLLIFSGAFTGPVPKESFELARNLILVFWSILVLSTAATAYITYRRQRNLYGSVITDQRICLYARSAARNFPAEYKGNYSGWVGITYKNVEMLSCKRMRPYRKFGKISFRYRQKKYCIRFIERYTEVYEIMCKACQEQRDPFSEWKKPV